MKRKYIKTLLCAVPLLILLAMLFFVNYTMEFLHKTTYDFVFKTNIDSIKHFSDNLEKLLSQNNENEGLFRDMMHIYNNNYGDRYASITFLLDSMGNVYHSNESNRELLSEVFDNKENEVKINQVKTKDNGHLVLQNIADEMDFYYQKFSDGKSDYYLFLSVDGNLINKKLNANAIIIPICVICLLLIISIEDSIWLRIVNEDVQKEKKVKKSWK